MTGNATDQIITKRDKNVLYRNVVVVYESKFAYLYEMYPATLITI
jgi:hypothetical protein